MEKSALSAYVLYKLINTNLYLLQFDGSLLHEAVASSSSTIVRMLLDAKADVDACSKVLAKHRPQ